MYKVKRKQVGPLPNSGSLAGCPQAKLVLLEKLQEGLLEKREAKSLAIFLRKQQEKLCEAQGAQAKVKLGLLKSTLRILEGLLLACSAGWICPLGAAPGAPSLVKLKPALVELHRELSQSTGQGEQTPVGSVLEEILQTTAALLCLLSTPLDKA